MHNALATFYKMNKFITFTQSQSNKAKLKIKSGLFRCYLVYLPISNEIEHSFAKAKLVIVSSLLI